jgi:predicted nucleic acid-binding protein
MNSPIQYDVILDTSILINFLAIDRVDLLGQYRRYRFLITAHVRSEVTHAAQLARLESAIEAGQLLLIGEGTLVLQKLIPAFKPSWYICDAAE